MIQCVNFQKFEHWKLNIGNCDMTDRQKYRLLEILPGTLTWTTILGAVALSLIKPLWAIYFIIVFDLYWLFRVSYFVLWLTISWFYYRKESRIDWYARVQELPGWKNIWHLIFLPTHQDEIEVLESTFEALSKSKYPHDRMMVVLAGEERDEERFRRIERDIRSRYAGQFAHFFITLHPDNLPAEIKGKGSNLNWSGKKIKQEIDRLQIPYDKIIVSAFDIDTVVHPQYFARLAHAFLTSPKPLRTSYQPLAIYNNNVWETPSFSRIVANSTTFWLMTELARPERLLTFSSHSMSWQALVDVGFWQKDVVNEDARISMQCIVRYHGDYRIAPLYVPVSMDTCYGGGFWRTVKNQYRQMQRWAWSVEHIPYLATNFTRDPLMPHGIKLRYLWLLIEGTYTWATASVLIFILGWFPLFVASYRDASSLLVQNAPFVLENLMRSAMIGIIMSALVNASLAPPHPRRKLIKFAIMIGQWALLPMTLILFGSLPAIDSQTRLMMGKYLGFWTTEKVRKSKI